MSNSHGSKKKSEGFFSIDRGAFRCAAVGGLNSAIANLILARGTGPDNVTTQWSVNAIEQRTGISRPNADKAVKDLLARGIWKKTRDGLHPIYEAVPGNQVPGGPSLPRNRPSSLQSATASPSTIPRPQSKH